MNPGIARRDLVVLVADRDMEAAIGGMLRRHASLGIRPVIPDIRRHPEKDCGCRTGGIEFLSPFVNQYDHALLMFDFEGCGFFPRIYRPPGRAKPAPVCQSLRPYR